MGDRLDIGQTPRRVWFAISRAASSITLRSNAREKIFIPSNLFRGFHAALFAAPLAEAIAESTGPVLK